MRIFGLVGYPLDHSWSPAYFARKFALENNLDDTYRLFPLADLKDFKKLIQHTEHLAGLNITIPYKVDIIPYLDDIDDIAKEVGSVNTVIINHRAGKIKTKGYNTDIIGFERSFSMHLKDHRKRAIVLGSGGASMAVTYVLKKLGIRYLHVSRNPSSRRLVSYEELSILDLSPYDIIINTTPVGQLPDYRNPLSDVVMRKITSRHLLFDLIYNPMETEFLKAGKEAGAICVNGMEMLMHQADESWKIWNK